MRRLDRAGHGDRHVLARPPVDLAQRVHGGDTTHVERQRISSGAAFEERVGYSRAVRVGDHVWVAGTAPIMPGDADPPATPYEQAQVCLEIIERALAEAGASLDDVVRTRIFVTDAAHIARGRPRPRRGVRDGAAGDDRDRHRAARPALAG